LRNEKDTELKLILESNSEEAVLSDSYCRHDVATATAGCDDNVGGS